MSVWTEVTGCVSYRRDCRMSLKTLVEELFQEATPVIKHDTSRPTVTVSTVAFSFSDSNLPAAKSLQEFVNRIKQYDAAAYVDLNASIRFLG